MQYIFACTVHTYYIYSLQYIYSTYNTYIYILYIYILGLRNETTNGWDDPCQRFPTMWQKVWSTWTSWGYLFKKNNHYISCLYLLHGNQNILPWEKENHLPNYLCEGDMFVPRRVHTNISMQFPVSTHLLCL